LASAQRRAARFVTVPMAPYVNFLALRGFLVDGKLDAASKMFREGVKIYPLSQAGNPPKMQFINGSRVPFNTVHANNFRDPRNAVYPNSQWVNLFGAADYRFLDDNGIGGRNLDSRTLFYYGYTLNTPAMVAKLVGRSESATSHRDSPNENKRTREDAMKAAITATLSACALPFALCAPAQAQTPPKMKMTTDIPPWAARSESGIRTSDLSLLAVESHEYLDGPRRVGWL
jgi:hypothetical protein